jgi:hypothetical protein
VVDIPPTTRRGSEIEVIRKRRALLREVNEQIRSTSGSFAPSPGSYILVCECERAECLQRFEVSAALYEDVRRDRERFLVVTGHEDDVDLVVAANGYSVVQVRPAARGFSAPSPLPAA